MMRFTRIYTLMFLAGLLSFSSCEEEEEASVANGKMVSLEFPIEISGMKQVGDETVDTRSAATDAEKAVKTLYVVQFNGNNAATSKAVAKEVVSTDGGNKVTFAKLSAVNANCRVYMVANVNPSVTLNTTTLGDFEKSLAAFSPTQTIPATGLPMCGYKDFNPTTVATAPRITLTAMVAKLVVRYNVSNSSLFKSGSTKLVLKNAASGTTYNQSATSAQGSLTVDNLALNTAYTFYVAENRAGINTAATAWEKRTLARIPTNSKPLYFEITGKDADNGSVLIVSLIGDPNKPTEFNINRNTCYTLTATINGFKSDERITVTPDMINLSASATANCYIVTAAGNYGFDGSKPGNNSTVSGVTKPSNLTTAVEARVLWQTGAAVGAANAVVKSVEYDETTRIVKFTTGSATEGNAVIGIFASNANNAPCLWSWHIWRLPSAPGTKTFNKTSATTGGTVSVTMMDRNLGAYNNTTNDAKSIGLLYQWGRKDPFPGPAGFNTTEPSNIYGSLYAGGAVKTFNGAYTIPAVKSDATTGTITYGIQYPGAFLYAGPSNDWLQTKDNNLWGTPWQDGGTGSYNKNQGTKSIYDPCPPGYRVPPQDTWNLQQNAGTWSNGMTMDKLGNFWFPAAGLRYGSSNAGKLAYGGSEGSYWSSSAFTSTSANGGILYFYSGNVNPLNYCNRAYGQSVRCVSE